MGMPELVVTAVLVEGRTKSEVARDYGVSRRWVITLVQRYLAEGEAGLQPRSRRPQHEPEPDRRWLEDEIVAIRKDLDRARARSRRGDHRLPPRSAATAPAPAVSTIWRILTARGFVIPAAAQAAQEHLRPLRSRPTQRTLADRHHPLAAGRRHRRRDPATGSTTTPGCCLASTARRVFKAPTSTPASASTPPAMAIPAAVLTDNGAVFTGRYRGGGRVALEITLHARGVVFSHSRPYHPQTCGKVERFHQTAQEVAGHPAPRRAPSPSCNASSTRSAATTTPCARTARCSRRTPQQAYARPTQGRRRRAPADRRRTTASATTRIDANGKLTLRHNSRLHHIGIGRRHAGTTGARSWSTTCTSGSSRTSGRTTPRPRPRPRPGLPTTAQNVNDVPRHLCTVSRDIAGVRREGLEPPTRGLRVRCSAS